MYNRPLIFILLTFYSILNGQQRPLDLINNVKGTSAFIHHEVLIPVRYNENRNIPSDLKDYSIYKIEPKALSNLLTSSNESISFSLPGIQKNDLNLLLVEVAIQDFTIRTSSGIKIKNHKAKHFRGIIRGEPKSIVSLSIFEDDIMGIISPENKSGNLVLGKIKDSDDYILYEDSDIMKHNSFDCGVFDADVQYQREELEEQMNKRSLSDCVKMYLEVDHNIFNGKGGMTPTVNYITGLYNQVATLYANEQINTTLSEIFVWNTPSPYTSSTSSGMLNQFTNYRNGFNGDMAMLLSYSASGGIAYVNTLCNSNPDYKMAFSSIASSFNNVPAYSWSVEVVAHEFGHIFGSQHTHACVWNGNNTAIDGCYAPEGSCPNPGIPSGGGTIMSYCHLTSTGINFNNGFGTQPGNLIRNKVTNATCLLPCSNSGTPTCSDGIQNQGETGIDCGGPNCPACNNSCTSNSGTLTLVLDQYPGETTWNIKNANGTTLYSGGPYATAGSTNNISLCLATGCYTFNIYDSYNDGICCAYGNGSYNIVFNGVNLASGGQFGSSQTKSFCVGGNNNTPTCTDGIKNGQETGVDCGGPTCPPCPSCNDGIKNQGETGVDCGGPCPACPPAPSCSDGIKNQGETGVDCGGPCPPCNSTASCTDGIQNQGETGIDCGGPCPACPTGTLLGGYYFETGWDGWTDGGEDANLYTGVRSFEGSNSIALRDDSGSQSAMTSPAFATSPSYNFLKVQFNFYAYSMEADEDFWLQYSNNNGSTWSTIGSWKSGTHFENGTFYSASITIAKSVYSFSANSKFRFVCDASTNADVIYVDAVKVYGQNTSNLEGGDLAMLSYLGEKEDAEIKIYPNPSDDQIFIALNDEYYEEKVNVELYDLLGRRVYFAEGLEKNNSYIRINNLNNGIYLMVIQIGKEYIYQQKISIQH